MEAIQGKQGILKDMRHTENKNLSKQHIYSYIKFGETRELTQL